MGGGSVNRRRLLRRLRAGHLANIRFDDFVDLVEGFGFLPARHEGSHRVFVHPRGNTLLSLQPARGEAKVYQLREFLKLVDRYDLSLEEE
jgi:predicted RNA binding protein YcfA (HicA-like mRNA interferase family)